jgi:deoxycytidylate deaminase
MDFSPRNITAEVPIIGFTGALGSGCSFFAESLCEHHGYKCYPLSGPLHEFVRSKQLPESVQALQDFGNGLRKSKGPDVLVRYALERADQEWPGPEQACPSGIILDGIRNTAEVQALRQLPNFVLVSVHAEPQKRFERLSHMGRVTSEQEFDGLDRRDAEQNLPHGQQVRRCNDLADVIVSNNKPVSEAAAEQKRQYVDQKLYDRYITLVERLATTGKAIEHQPTLDEALMTIAYCMSRRSSCLKRKVGAVIGRRDNAEILAVGYNEVPEGSKSCLDDEEYGWCARDRTFEEWGKSIRHCPRCGEPVDLHVNCVHCGRETDTYLKRCPGCGEDPGIVYRCSKCQCDIYGEYLPGSPIRSGRLLDVCRALHAEEAALLSLSKRGTATPSDAVLYTTTFPCTMCANKIAAMGISRVVYAEPYSMQESRRVLDQRQVEVSQFEGVKSGAFFRLYR